MTSAQGIDVSAYQPPLTAGALEGLDFAFAKATDGPYGTDPDFAVNWAVIRAAGKHRGTYHELQPGAPSAQAAHFLATVQAQGLKAGDMLACVASDYPASDADVRAFCDSVKAATGGRNPVLVYSDLSVAATLTSCTGYDLWVAWPSGTAPASVAPWKTWRLWQWQLAGLDRDAYNGTPAQMTAWLATFTPPPVPPDWVFGPVRSLTLVNYGPHSLELSWYSPGAPMPLGVGSYDIAVCEGTALGKVYASYPRSAPKEAASKVTWSGGSLAPGRPYVAAVRAVAAGGGHASPWAEVRFTTPAA